MTANSIGPKRVLWECPPFNLRGGEEDVATLTTFDLDWTHIRLDALWWPPSRGQSTADLRRGGRKPCLIEVHVVPVPHLLPVLADSI